MKYVGNLSVRQLQLMGHKEASIAELTELANRLNASEIRIMDRFIKSLKLKETTDGTADSSGSEGTDSN